jgi:hypothetical protein
MFLKRSTAEWKASDFVVVLSTTVTSSPSDPQTVLTFFLGPETVRNSATTAPSGMVISDVPFARIPPGFSRPLDLCLLVLDVTRNRRSQRVLETVDSMIPAIDYGTDLLGSMSWADAILDRLDVLAYSPDGRCVFAAASPLPADRSAAARYCAFVRPDLLYGGGSTPLVRFVRNGRLWDGIDASTASPSRHQEFVLLRIGRQIDKPQPVSIHQLRRDRLSGGTAYRLDQGKPNLDYVTEQERLRKVRRLQALYGPKGVNRAPIVTPVALEVAKDLIPLVESGPGSISRAFQETLTLMKDGLRYELGVEMPSVRIRGNESEMPDGMYIIMINEIPLVSGTVTIGRSMTNSSVDRLKELGIGGTKAVNPANGNECAWVAESDYERVKAAGFHLWSPAEYLVLHLSAVLRKNVAEFLGMRSVAELVRARSAELYAGIRAARGGLPRFAVVLAILAEEEVPLHAMDQICGRYLQLAPSGRPLYEIVEEIRGLDALRGRLRYNENVVNVYRLADRVTGIINAGMHYFGDSALLALVPENAQEVLTAVRNEVAKLAPAVRNPFVLVDDWKLRRPVRKLIELEFPYLRVLAARELSDLGSDSIKEIGVIDVNSGANRRPRRK